MITATALELVSRAEGDLIAIDHVLVVAIMGTMLLVHEFGHGARQQADA